MVREAQREAQVVKEVLRAGARRVVALVDEFVYKGHYCIVMERMRVNLRQLLAEKGNGVGLNIAAVALYAAQLFDALRHLHTVCQVYHCDIKPDNILADQSLRTVKLADFGSALHPFEAQPQASLGSRFYRSPEVIVGYRWNGETDVWSLAATLAELSTGAILFPGTQNNDMLWWFMQFKGKFPPKMAREGKTANEHFTPDLMFVHEEQDKSGKAVFRKLNIKQPARRFVSVLIPPKAKLPQATLNRLYNFNDLLEKAFVLDPDKRITASAALSHPFCAAVKLE